MATSRPCNQGPRSGPSSGPPRSPDGAACLPRRALLGGLGAAAFLPRPARAQSSPMPVVGYLGPESPGPYASRLAAFREGLARAGYGEGRNLAIEFRWAEGQYDRLSALARDLVQRRIAVLAAPGGAPIALAAKEATATVPIVFEMGGDPVALGVVDDLAQPRGNITGVSSLSVELSRKRLEFMHECLPQAGSFPVIVNPTSPTVRSQLASLHDAAQRFGVQLQVYDADRERDFPDLFATLSARKASGVVFTSDPYFANRSQPLADLALRHGLPAITQSRDFALAGGLMSYGGDFMQSHRQAGFYVGRILRGERPADLPVQLVTKVELFVNLRAAHRLGVTVPTALLSGADTVIE